MEDKKKNKGSKERPADILVTKMFRDLKKNYSLIGKGRVISWKAWLAVGLVVGITAGVVYVANRSGEFEAGRAQSPVEVSFIMHNDAGQEIAKVGTTNLNHQWKTVTLDRPFLNPVVIAKPISMNESEPAHVRIKFFEEEIEEEGNVAPTFFKARVEEWRYEDGRHVNEQVSYIVMESGVHTIDGKKIEAGKITAGNNFSTVTFPETFASSPVVLSQSQTLSELDPIVTRNQNITATGFRVKVQEDEASVSVNGGHHERETIGYIAAERGVYNNVGSMIFEVGTMPGVTNKWSPIYFGSTRLSSKDILFLADMQTTNGKETANIRFRFRNLPEASVEIKAQEEKSKDTEMTHKAESIGYFVIGRALGKTSCGTLEEKILNNFGKSCGSPDFDPVADVVKDGFGNISDITFFIANSNDGTDEVWCTARLADKTDFCNP